jgi:two-component system OmpR family response regulator
MNYARQMNLLLAEDDAILSDALTAQLRQAGFQVELADNGAVAEYLLMRHGFDLAVIDLGLPLVDGLTVLKRVRAAKPALPVLVLTALDGLEQRVAGLNAGADDYLTKPFDFPELEARLRALLRRSRNSSTGSAQELGRLTFDRDARRASINGEPIELSPREWMLLDLLLSQRDKVVTKDQIAQAWAPDRGNAGRSDVNRSEPSGPGSIEVYIHRLRRKLESSGLTIRTVRGLGYLLEAEGSG